MSPGGVTVSLPVLARYFSLQVLWKLPQPLASSPVSLRRVVLSIATAIMAGGLAAAAVPAAALDSGSEPTVYRFSLPGSVKAGATTFSLPGDVVTKKSRGGVLLEKVTLSDMVVIITRQAARGRSVGGTITIKGTTRPMRGLPVLLDDGSVKIRVAQGRGSRALVLPRGGGAATGSAISCPPGTTATYDSKSGKYVCK